ncbi:TrkA C-terminal domain-containing protein [Globicatella sanguinis]
MSYAKTPAYQKISRTLIDRIASGYYQEGQKLSIRTDITSEFKVSPETARKAVNYLVKLDIMHSYHGSGTFVASKDRAVQYIKNNKDEIIIDQLHNEISQGLSEQQQTWKVFQDKVTQLIDYSYKMKLNNPFNPFEIYLDHNAKYLGKSIESLNLWPNTHATLVALERENELILSPNPKSQLKEKDVLYFIGEPQTIASVKTFFY